MRILFLNNYYYIRGGSERIFFGEIDIMKKHGHATAGFSRQHPSNLPSEYAGFFPPDIVTEKISISWTAAKALKEIIYSGNARDNLDRLISEFKPDIAHIHNMYGRLTTSVLDLLTRRNIPAVMTLHDYKLSCPSYRFMYENRICEDCRGGRYYMAIRNRCHKDSYVASAAIALESYFNTWLHKYKKNIYRFVSPSRFLRDKFIQFGWPREQIRYIPNFLDLTQFEPNYTRGNYFLYIGRLSEEKGIETLIKAFSALAKGKTELLVAGDGPMRDRLASIAGDNSRIRFLGYLSGSLLLDCTRNALAIVVPSEWYENAPLSILEAMAYGKPVIGASIGGIPEMIRDGIDGKLFESSNVDALKNVLQYFEELSATQVTEMGRNARRQVEEINRSETHYDNLMGLYTETLGKGKV